MRMESKNMLHEVVITAIVVKDGKYLITRRTPPEGKENILRMPDDQVALSTLQHDLPQLEKYLKMPQVHLGAVIRYL